MDRGISPAWAIPLTQDQLMKLGVVAAVWNQVDNLIDLHFMALTGAEHDLAKEESHRLKLKQRLKKINSLYNEHCQDSGFKNFCQQCISDAVILAEKRDALFHSYFGRRYKCSLVTRGFDGVEAASQVRSVIGMRVRDHREIIEIEDLDIIVADMCCLSNRLAHAWWTLAAFEGPSPWAHKI